MLLKIPIQLLKLAKNDLKFYLCGGFCVLACASYLIKRMKIEIYEMRKKRFPKNVVILHRLNKGFKVPHDKPELMKLETWLRMANIPYEVYFCFFIYFFFFVKWNFYFYKD